MTALRNDGTEELTSLQVHRGLLDTLESEETFGIDLLVHNKNRIACLGETAAEHTNKQLEMTAAAVCSRTQLTQGLL